MAAQEKELLNGEVEIDEGYFGGRKMRKALEVNLLSRFRLLDCRKGTVLTCLEATP